MMTTPDEMIAMAERLSETGVLDGGAKMSHVMRDAAAMLRSIAAERDNKGLAIVDRAKLTAVLDTASLDYNATPADRDAIAEIRAMIEAGR